MTGNPVIEKLGRRLRLGVLGGGPGSIIGEVHRTAARLDDRYEVVGGVLSSNPERSRAAGRALGWAPERAYGDVGAMLAAETARSDGVDVVAIMTPPTRATIRSPVAGSMPGGTSSATSRSRPASKMPAISSPGCGRAVSSSAPPTTTPPIPWCGRRGRWSRTVTSGSCGSPRSSTSSRSLPCAPIWRIRLLAFRCRPVRSFGDPGGYRHPRLAPAACGHRCGAARGLRRRRAGGAGTPVRRYRRRASPLRERRPGDAVGDPGRGRGRARPQVPGPWRRGGLEWRQEEPTWLTHLRLGQPRRKLSRGGPGLKPAAERACRIAIGHPEGFHEAFANLYSDVAEAVAARLAGTRADPLPRLPDRRGRRAGHGVHRRRQGFVRGRRRLDRLHLLPVTPAGTRGRL